MSEVEPSAAHMLEGRNLDGGWTVERKIIRPEGATGANFSVGYVVRNENGEDAFLKALDYTAAFSSENVPQALEGMTHAFNYEANLLRVCSERRMNRVVRAVGEGQLNIPEARLYPVVNYLIFEKADGDIRNLIADLDQFDGALALRSLHNITVGVNQLHSALIAHQDVKPSNVLIFEQEQAKIGDLGRATQESNPADHDEYVFAGDRGYAPPELLYGFYDDDWRRRRFSIDMYQIGNLCVFLFVNSNVSSELVASLPYDFHPLIWAGEDYEEVLPLLQESFSGFLHRFQNETKEIEYREKLCEIVKYLCNPDPRHRGHPLNIGRVGQQYQLERFISMFSLLAKRAELRLTRGRV